MTVQNRIVDHEKRQSKYHNILRMRKNGKIRYLMLFGLKMSSWGIFSQIFISLSHSYFLPFWIPLGMIKPYHQELKNILLKEIRIYYILLLGNIFSEIITYIY